MKVINYLIFVFVLICLTNNNQAQTISCDTDFWTINVEGNIQQWSLNNVTVSGGEVVLSGGGTSLSYCNHNNISSFYSNNFNAPYNGFTYFDADTGWVNVSDNYLAANSNGGHLNDQYYVVEGGFIQIIKYWDGINSSTVDSLHLQGQFFAGTQDIAVDTLGQAWIFTGPVPSNVDSLKVYNQFGVVASYSIDFDAIAYGSFFLNNTLYLGTNEDAIYPVILDGSSAYLGSPILFPTSNYTDMASCQLTDSTSAIDEYSKEQISVFPNPTTGNFTIDLGENYESVKITISDFYGKIIQSKVYKDNHLLDIQFKEPPGVYVLKVETGVNKTVFRMVKV